MLVRLHSEGLDDYHQRRANKHGLLYVVVRQTDPDFPLLNLYEAKAIATGVVCTLYPEYTESADAAQL